MLYKGCLNVAGRLLERCGKVAWMLWEGYLNHWMLWEGYINVVGKLSESCGKVAWMLWWTLPERCKKGYFYVNGSFRYNVVTTLQNNVIDTKT